jgi:DHA1 family bicyclomycin/chloramphenicol resistance-like MFS transporter
MTANPRQPPFALLAAMTALAPLAQNIYIPSLPALPEVFGASYGAVQLTLSLYFLGFALSQLVYGPLSDRFGRRPVMLTGLTLFCVGTATCLLAPSLWLLIVGRFVQAAGGCAGLMLTRAVIRDVYSREKAASVIAYVVMAMVVAPMFAPLIGGLIDEWLGWRANFALTGLVGIAVLVAALALLKETSDVRQPLPGVAGVVRIYRSLARHAAFRAYAGNATFQAAGFFAFLGGAPYVVIEVMGRSPSEYGLYFIIPAVTYMAGNFLAGRISQDVGVDRMVVWGTWLAWVGASLMLLAALSGVVHPLAVFLPMALFALGNGLGLPNAMAAAVSVDPAYVGTASGLLGFSQMTAGAVSSAIVGALSTDSALPLATLMLVTATLAAVYSGVVLREADRSADGEATVAE